MDVIEEASTIDSERRRKIATVGVYGCLIGCGASFGLIPPLGMEHAFLPMFALYAMLIGCGGLFGHYGKLKGNPYAVPFEFTQINPGTGSPIYGCRYGVDASGYSYGANAFNTRPFSSTDP